MANIEDDSPSDDDEEDWTAPMAEGLEYACLGHAARVTQPPTIYKTEVSGNSDPSPCDPAPETPTPQNGGKDGLVSRMQLNDNKAGMEGLDRERINKIIYETSKGSRFYENELKKEKQMAARIAEMQRRLALLSPEQIQSGEQEADRILCALEDKRDLTRTIVHVDMDMFYAAVEMKDNPALCHVPMAVGSSSMLSTSNYIARRFGVRAAMPGFIGRKLCPDLVIVPTNFEKYTAVSKQICTVLADYDPHFSPMSLDEAFLDMTSLLEKRATSSIGERTFQTMLTADELCKCDAKISRPMVCGEGTSDLASFSNAKVRDSAQDIEPTKMADTDTAFCDLCGKPLCASRGKVETFGLSTEEAVREMRARIHWETKLTASAGIAPNTMLAKVCSDQNKPNGQYYMPPSRDAILDFVNKLDIRKVCGIGKVAAQMLRSLGVNTCTDLYARRGILYHLYSEVSFNYFLRISVGISSNTVERDGEKKSMSVERTFSEIRDPKDLYQKCHELSVSLAEDLSDEQFVGKTVGIKLKTVNFRLMTRAQTLRNPTCDVELIYRAARELLRAEILLCHPDPLRLRLMGVRMSNLMPKDAAGDQKQCTIKSLLSKMKSKPPDPGSTSMVLPSDEFLTSDSTTGKEQNIHSGDVADVKSKTQRAAPHLHSRSASKKLTFLCPICSEDIAVANLNKFNRHVDECLARSPSEVMREDSLALTGASVTCGDETVDTMPEPDQTRHVFLDVGTLSSSPVPVEVCLQAGGESSDTETPYPDMPGHARHNIQMVDSKTYNTPMHMELDVEHSHSDSLHLPERSAQIEPDENRAQTDNGLTVRAALCDTPTKCNLSQEVADRLICLICNKQQATSDLAVFNNHMDECLNRDVLVTEDRYQAPAPNTAVTPKMFSKATGRTKKKATSQISSSSMQKAGCARSTSVGVLLSQCATSPQTSGSTPGEEEGNVVMTCPVCDLRQEWTTQGVFSHHVDSCLNRAAIRDMLNGDTDTLNKRQLTSPPDGPASKRKKSLAKGIQRIDSFFKR